MFLRPVKPSKNAAAKTAHFQSFDLLATLVAVVRSDGTVLFANAALEDVMGTSRRTIEGSALPEYFAEPGLLRNALDGAGGNEFAALRYDTKLKRLNHDPMPVHVIVAQTERSEPTQEACTNSQFSAPGIIMNSSARPKRCWSPQPPSRPCISQTRISASEVAVTR